MASLLLLCLESARACGRIFGALMLGGTCAPQLRRVGSVICPSRHGRPQFNNNQIRVHARAPREGPAAIDSSLISVVLITAISRAIAAGIMQAGKNRIGDQVAVAVELTCRDADMRILR